MKFRYLSFVFTLLYAAVYAQEKISLEQVIALSLQRNYDVQLSNNTLASSTVNNSYAWAAFTPQLNANAAVLFNNNNQKLEFQDQTRNASGQAISNNITGNVQLVWTLFDGTKMFATRERMAVIAEQGELIVKDQMTNTIADVITNYYDIVRQKQRRRATLEQMAVSEERVKLADKRLQVGTGAKPELLQAKVDFNAQRTEAIQQEAAILQLKEQLNVLLGAQLPASFDVSDTIPININLRQDEVGVNIENSNYTLLALQRNMRIASLLLHERRSELLPVLNFNGAYNFSRVNNTLLINPFSALFSQSQGFNYGLSLSVPILNGLNTRRQIEIAKVTLDREKLLYDQQKIIVDAGIRNAFTNYNNAKEVLLIEEENILLAKENVSIALETFRRGTTTFIELRTAQQSLADAYNRLITARYNTKLAETELLRLNGGLLK